MVMQSLSNFIDDCDYIQSLVASQTKKLFIPVTDQGFGYTQGQIQTTFNIWLYSAPRAMERTS